MTQEEIEEALRLLDQLEQDPHVFPRYNEIYQIKLHKPHSDVNQC